MSALTQEQNGNTPLDAETGEGVSVIVACRNEQDTIARCLSALTAALPRAEVLVVDGGSDGTLDVAASMRRDNPLIVPIRNVGDRGKGHAIKTGIARASRSVMCQFDCDLQFFAEDLPALLAPIRRGDCELTLGSRFLPGSDRTAYRPSFFRDVGNRLMSLYISCLIGRRATDVTAGIKAWTRDAIRKIDFLDDRYSYEAEIVVRAATQGLRFRDVPVRYADRAAGASMHRNSLAVIRAGAVIMVKALRARFR